jgi:hypothetical protein
MIIFWDVAPHNMVKTDRHFLGAYCLHHQVMRWMVMTVAVSTSETPENTVNCY